MISNYRPGMTDLSPQSAQEGGATSLGIGDLQQVRDVSPRVLHPLCTERTSCRVGGPLPCSRDETGPHPASRLLIVVFVSVPATTPPWQLEGVGSRGAPPPWWSRRACAALMTSKSPTRWPSFPAGIFSTQLGWKVEGLFAPRLGI